MIEDCVPIRAIYSVNLLDETNDVRGDLEVRRVEVKGRKRSSNVVLTRNEWFKARQLGDRRFDKI